MLVALNQRKDRCLAWETEKSNLVFHCPKCKGEVLLKKGKIREHHFAHKPPYDCNYGAGESQLHLKVKREIYLALVNHPNCKKCELERRLDGVYPDISLYIGNTRVVIEVQRSIIDIDLIIKRTLQYAKLGCYILWVLPTKQPKPSDHLIRKLSKEGNLEEEVNVVTRPKQWEKYLHTLYYGRIYYWQEGAIVTPYHFDKVEQYVKETSCEWYNENGERESDCWGDYYKPLKAIKYFIQGKSVNIADEFTKALRKEWKSKSMSIPLCKLWINTQENWW